MLRENVNTKRIVFFPRVCYDVNEVLFMITKSQGRIICCVFAVILFFLGIGVEVTTTNSSFLCSQKAIGSTSTNNSESVANTLHAMIYANRQIIEEAPVCTPSMLENRTEFLRANRLMSTLRRHSRVFFLILIAGIFLQYLLGRLTQVNSYQGTECKEDGQLFLCRTVVVDYIHRKDSGE